MILKVKFLDKDKNEEYTMLFGNSYKNFQTQLEEYLRTYGDRISILKKWKSQSGWIGWGGLKWCSEENFQHELNREGCQSDEPDNPKPRQYKDMIFAEA